MQEQFDIVISTINSRYQHSSFGLRYLYANLNELQAKTKIVEFVLGKHPRDIVENILQLRPRIVGFGVYIWNTQQILETISILKKIAPEIIVVLGGPEISYETESQAHFVIADFVIKGEADFLFYDFCKNFFEKRELPSQKIISGEIPEIKEIRLPYQFYSSEDIAHRVIYVEASRGCPFKCEYCLSSLDKSVRNFAIDQFLNEIDSLIQRGARQFKFVDRTFNLSPTISCQILQFFLARIECGLFLHFEMVPDRLPEEIKNLIVQFPKGSLQFEIGIQTWNPVVAKNVSRRQDYQKISENLVFLRDHTKVHTHVDLIIGLPGETKESFARGFDQVVELGADEVQVGILKRLKGTPIVRHDQNYKMKYSAHSPFQILSNSDLDYLTLQKLNRFAQFWDLYGNSGNFNELLRYFKNFGVQKFQGSLFSLFWHFSDYLFARHGQAHAISLQNLKESARQYLIDVYQLENIQIDLILINKKVQVPGQSIPNRQLKHYSKVENTLN